MTKLTNVAPAGRQMVQAYGDGIFRVSGTTFNGSVIILPHMTIKWAAQSYESITPTILEPLTRADLSVELLLIGCGANIGFPRDDIRNYLKELNITSEWMDTGAACRTFNVLVTEDRAVGAALIAVD